MKKTCLDWLFLVFVMLFIKPTLAQKTTFSGLILDDTAYAAVPVVPRYTGIKSANIPVQIDLKPYFPTPKNQGDVSSCVGWATGYAALTAYRAIQSDITAPARINQMANSALFLYNQIIPEQSCKSGATITDALQLLKTKGDCLYSDFDVFVQCPEQPSDNLKKRADLYQIEDYFSLFKISAGPKLKIAKTRQSLAEKKPVIIGMKVTADFLNLKNKENLWQPKANAISIDDHAMVVVGYDDINKRFELMNSSGTDWGNAGFIWVSYEDYARWVKYGFQLALTKEEKQNHALKGNFMLRYPYAYKTNKEGYRLNDDEGCPIHLFKQAKVNLNPTTFFYDLAKENSRVGSTFQLIASQISSNNHLYVFGISPKNEITEYFHRKRDATTIATQDVQLIIPGICKAIKIKETGRQYIYALISEESQKDLFEQLATLSNKDRVNSEKIIQYLEDKSLALNQVNFQPTTIAGKATGKGDATSALLFVIEIDAFE